MTDRKLDEDTTQANHPAPRRDGSDRGRPCPVQPDLRRRAATELRYTHHSELRRPQVTPSTHNTVVVMHVARVVVHLTRQPLLNLFHSAGYGGAAAR